MTSIEKASNTCINEREYRREPINLSEYFREQRKALQKEYGEGGREYYPTEEIASSLGISTDMLQQRIYGKKPLTREWLIAIGAAHGLDSFQIDELLLQLEMPRLDGDVPREDFITDFLKKEKDAPVGKMISLNELNKALIERGYSPIDTGKQKREKKQRKTERPFHIEKQIIRTYMDEGDQYESLSTAYDFRYSCVAIAYLSKDSQMVARLEASSDETFLVDLPGTPLPRLYRTLLETGIYREYFADLLSLARRERHRVEMQLFDSKNYQGRYAANLKNDRIHVFYEEFNYLLPERNEYYLMEWFEGHLRLTVSNQSRFMREYLSQNQYLQIYGNGAPQSQRIYDSIEEIEGLLESRELYESTSKILHLRKTAFQRMGRIVLQVINEIKNRKAFIRNFEAIYGDNPGEVCRFFNLLDEFNCTIDEDNIVSVGSNTAQFMAPNGGSISLTFEEMKRAFELGYCDKAQIIRNITAFGSVEAVFGSENN